jgi:hypothetical protein
LKQHRSSLGITLTLFILALVLAYSIRQIVQAWPHVQSQTATSPHKSALVHAPIQLPDGAALQALQVPGGQTIVYEDQHHIYRLETGKAPQQLQTPGLVYNRAVPPLVTADKQLIYSGETGIWQMSLSGGSPRQLASIGADQVITSLKVSKDGSTLAYSTAPANGSGMLTISVGPLQHLQRIFQEAANLQPSFRVFSFLNDSNNTLLLSDDRGDHRSVWYGLWLLEVSTDPGNPQQPRALLLDSPLRGPLAIAQDDTTVLYSSDLGFAPTPLHDVPDDISSVTYANSLSVATIDESQKRLVDSRVLLPAQGDLANTAHYRWVDTPRFSPDGGTLVYAEFSSDKSQNDKFPRYYALYSVATDGKSEPQLLASVTAKYIEVGDWLNDHVVTFYADNALYAFDVQQHRVTQIATTGEYARIIAIVA